MRINIHYTVETGGIGRPVHSVIGDDRGVTQVSTWLTDHLCLGFSSLEDLDQAIERLQALKTEAVNKMVSQGSKFLPYRFQTEGQPLIIVSAHTHGETEKCSLSVDTIDTDDNELDVISLNKGNGFTYQTVDLYVDGGQAIPFSQELLAAAIRNDIEKGGNK